VKVVVFGATGFVGRALLPLLKAEHDVVAVSRRHQPEEDGVRWVVTDVTSAAGVEAALDGADAAYYLVHSLGARDFAALDRTGAETVAAAAAKAGVHQLVYLGGLGDDADLSEHLKSRRDTAEALSSGSVPVTTLRAAMIVGAGSAAFETILALVNRLPGMVMPRWVSTETQPIALADITRYLAGVLGREEALGRTYDTGGPEVMTYREMIERIAALRGKHPLLVEVPVLTPRLSSYWLHLVTPVKAGVARPLIEGLRNTTVAHDDSIRELVPFELTPFDVAAREALA
jgi:uncharacterized protein YbjT (DUF2867 family)